MKRSIIIVFFLSLLVVVDCDALNPESETIKIAAFNIQNFGKSKSSIADVMDVLEKIAREFDIMLIQEIVDVDEQTAELYLNGINNLQGPDYAFIRSKRIGRGIRQEAYAYFYNTETVEFIEGSNYVYMDKADVFEREPYIASFRSGNFDFTLVGIHTKPEDTVTEIGALVDVFDSVIAKNPDEKDVILIGDLNADGRFFNEDSNDNPLRAFKFDWVITNDMDTMTKSDWTYDRMIMTAATSNHEYVHNSASVFYFDKEFAINNKQLVWDVSDHYPIYAEFQIDMVNVEPSGLLISTWAIIREGQMIDLE